MNKDSKIYVAGHRGMVGSAILRLLIKEGYSNIVYATSSEVDLRNQQQVNDFFDREKPDYVFLAAAKVGGIQANNTYKADFMYDNLMIEANVIHAAYKNEVNKLLFLGSSCIYPKNAPQPIKEEYLLSDYLEETNKPYALAKISGISLCQSYNDQYGTNFISAMPTNLYGPNDNYDLNNSHVFPALIRKFHEAKLNNQATVEIWGTGKPMREFLHVDDLASASLFLMHNYNSSDIINVGYGKDITIADLAHLVKDVTECSAEITFNTTKPDGTLKKVMDVSKIKAIGWEPKISLKEGLKSVYKEFSAAYEPQSI